MDEILRILMGPWTTYILWCLRTDGALRFGALKSRMPAISSKVLTERLRLLENAGLIDRDYQPTIPPTVTYSLTGRGAELKDVLDGLGTIAVRWKAEDQRKSKRIVRVTTSPPSATGRSASSSRPGSSRPSSVRR